MSFLSRLFASYLLKPWMERSLRDTLLLKRRNNRTNAFLLVVHLVTFVLIHQAQVPSAVKVILGIALMTSLHVLWNAMKGNYDRSSLARMRQV